MSEALSLPDRPSPPQVLGLIERVRAALEKVERPTEAAQLVRHAEAIQYLAKKAEASLSVQQEAGKIAILSKQRAGELLAKVEKHEGGRPSKNHSQPANGFKLDELGIAKDDSSRWQQLATVSRHELEKHLDELIDAGGEPTTAEAIRFARPREDTPEVDDDRGLVGDVYRFIREAQTIKNRFREGVSASQFARAADEEQRAYMRDQLTKTIELIKQLLEEM